MRKIAIFGVGLIGGSFALALKRDGIDAEIVGAGRSAASLERARELGIIDRVARDPADAAADADLVLLAAPVAQTGPILTAIGPYLSPNTIVTDAGSTKADVVAAARAALGGRIGRFVPGHPIAGRESNGPDAALAELYQNRKVVLTPLPENDAADVALVEAAWRRCGALVQRLTPEAHDRVFAAVSHLPHLLAYALVDDLAARPDAELLFAYAASGFRDFTRIAGSSPEMWRDIALANRDALREALASYQQQLRRIESLLDAGDAAGLEALFASARQARNAWAHGAVQAARTDERGNR